MKDYANGCPLCGVRHHTGTTVGFSGINKRCAARWGRMPDAKRAAVTARYLLARQARA